MSEQNSVAEVVTWLVDTVERSSEHADPLAEVSAVGRWVGMQANMDVRTHTFQRCQRLVRNLRHEVLDVFLLKFAGAASGHAEQGGRAAREIGRWWERMRGEEDVEAAACYVCLNMETFLELGCDVFLEIMHWSRKLVECAHGSLKGNEGIVMGEIDSGRRKWMPFMMAKIEEKDEKRQIARESLFSKVKFVMISFSTHIISDLFNKLAF